MDQKYLFVNSDASTVGARANLKTIQAHVQSYHHKHRRKKLRRSLVCSLPVDGLRMVQSQKVAPNFHSSISVPSEPSNPEPSSVQDTIGFQNEPVKSGTVYRRDVSSVGPNTILQKGNSDPFSALAVPITPTTNLLLLWHRDIDIPSLYPFESRSNTSTSTGMSRDWQQAIRALQEPCMAHSFISSIAAWMALSTQRQDCLELSLVSKVKSYQIVRTYPARTYKWTRMKLYNVIIYIFWAEIATEALVPAGLHLRMLWQLIRAHDSPEAFDPWWRERIMFADVEYATMQLTRPFFDVDRWSFETSYTDWMEGSKFEAFWDSNTQLSLVDASVEDVALKAIFSGLKKTLAVEDFYKSHQLPTVHSVFLWMEARVTQFESQLLRMYADAVSLTQRSGSLQAADSHLVKECTCLALIVWITIAFKHVAGKKKKFLLARMRKAVTRCEDLLLPRLRIWTLFVGAALEHCVNGDFEGTSREDWHESKLEMQARIMGMQSSQQFRPLLLAFLFSDRLEFYWPPFFT